MDYPAGKRFAFTILDDTDDSTVDNVKPVYDLLANLGFRTTKTVWPVACPEGSSIFFAAETMEAPKYAAFAHQLAEHGFEITWHCATMESSTRPRIEAGLERFREFFGHYPSLHCNHGNNRENIYWGLSRYWSPGLKQFRQLVQRARPDRFEGDRLGSAYFWGDLCRTHCRYVRNFTFKTLNTHSADPESPYRLSATPYANLWFSTSDAPDLQSFNRLVNRASIDALVDSGGYGIVSTHLGKGFCRSGRLDPGFVDSMTYLAAQGGWFVPVSTLLDHLVANGRGRELSALSLARLEWRHIFDRLKDS